MNGNDDFYTKILAEVDCIDEKIREREKKEWEMAVIALRDGKTKEAEGKAIYQTVNSERHPGHEGQPNELNNKKIKS